MMRFQLVGLLVVFLSVSSEGRSLSGATDGQEVNVLSRSKRGLYDGTPEYSFFDDFFKAWKGSSDDFRSAIDPSNGQIKDWGKLLGKQNAEYKDALEKATDFYREQKLEGKSINGPLKKMDDIIRVREIAGRKHGGLDASHQRVVNGWRSARNTLSQVAEGNAAEETVALISAPAQVGAASSWLASILVSIFTFGLIG